MKVILISAVFIWVSASAWSENLDNSSQQALEQTQQLLKDPSDRNKAIAQDPKAVKVDQFIGKLGGGNAKVSEEVYALAAEVFATVVKNANGDPDKMKKAMEEFAKDPESFEAQWTPEQKEKFHHLSSELTPAPNLKP